MKIIRLFSVLVAAALALAPALFAFQQQAVVRSLGVISLNEAQQRTMSSQFSFAGAPHEALRPMPRPHFATSSAAITAPLPSPTNFPVVKADTLAQGFSGINTEDSNDGNGGGTAGIGEPPDQGLATNGTQVFEVINISMRIFSPGGTPLTDNIGLPQFFGVPPSDGGGVSNYLSDPRAFFDPQSKRFFMSILEYQVNTVGLFVGSENLLAVSESSNALGNYFLYSIEACPSLSGSTTPIPCLADQPLIGVNSDGFYFNNNLFSSTGHFLATEIIALNIESLIHNTPVNGAVFLSPVDFTVEPSLPAPGQITTQYNGVEYFIESLDNGTGANTLRIFAMTNTENLETGGVPTIVGSDFPSEFYTNPVPANQKAGPYPLGQHFGDPEEFLNTDDDRQLQVYYAGGRLYTTLETQVASDTVERTGAAWFVIQPTTTLTSVTATVVHQGYIAIANGSVMYPAFAATNLGVGVIGFSFSGTNFFPSTGYVHFQNGAIGTQVHTAGLGQNPEDGFSGYPQFGGDGVARWGDYSSAFVSPAGHLWFAAEYIPDEVLHPRTQYTNFGTFVEKVQ